MFRSYAYATYVNGKLSGNWLVTYQDGKTEETGSYVNGHRDGKWIRYYNTGDTFMVCNYTQGVLNGEYKTFSVGNKVTRQGLFVDGKKEGKWIETAYTGKGQLWATTIYPYESDALNGPLETHTFSYVKTSWFENGVQGKTDSLPKVDSAFVNQPWPPPDEVLSFAAEMPQFPGGNDTLNKYFSDNTIYPKSAIDGKKEGTCYIKFTVEKDGSISDVSVVKGIKDAPELDAEAVRLVKEMPKWEPGRMNGRPVRVTETIPIKFVL